MDEISKKWAKMIGEALAEKWFSQQAKEDKALDLKNKAATLPLSKKGAGECDGEKKNLQV